MNGLYEEFRIAVHSVWQRRWLAMGIAWVICLLGWLGVAMIPNTYESQAKLFVQTKSILADNTGVNPADQQKQIDTVQQTLTSATNLEKVVRGTDLGKGLVTPREIEGAVNGLRTAIKIKSEQSNLFEISATMTASGRSDGEAANLSRAVVQKLIDLFVEENLAGGRGETSDTLRFLDEQLAKRQKELEIAEQKRVKFETENLGMLPGIGSVSQRLEQGRVEINQIDSQLIAAQSALAAINGQIAGTPQSIAGAAGGGGVNPLAQAQGELAAMGCIDPADRRNRLLDKTARRWREQPPLTPVIAAGITTSAPAIARLLRSIADLPQGMVVLPGLDLDMDEALWEALGNPVTAPPQPGGEPVERPAITHPQYHLKQLLHAMSVGRAEVEPWQAEPRTGLAADRARLLRSIFLPARLSDRWVTLEAADRRTRASVSSRRKTPTRRRRRSRCWCAKRSTFRHAASPS